MKLREIAERLSCRLQCVNDNDSDGDLEITRVAPIGSAGEGELSFVTNLRYRAQLATTNATALILSDDEPWSEKPSLRSDDPSLLLAKVIDLLYPEKQARAGIDPSAVIAQNAETHISASIGALVVIGENSVIGAETTLKAHVTIGDNVRIGEHCLIYPGVRILDDSIIGNRVRIHAGTVIGSDGYGYATGTYGHKKILQVGNVIIENDVEIGANCAIDRGALDCTRIGAGTKIDNLVQIAHNVKIGENCLIVAQVGVSGSTILGNWVTIAGQSGTVGHLTIGDHTVVAGRSGVSKNLPEHSTVLGSPAREIRKARRIEACITRLPESFKRVKALEDAVANLQKKTPTQSNPSDKSED